MNKGSLSLLPYLCSGLLAFNSFANTPSFEYFQPDKTLKLSGEACLNGRANKTKLPEWVKEQVHGYVMRQQDAFFAQMRDIKTGMVGRQLTTAQLAVIYQWDNERTDWQYFFEGNAVCVRYQQSFFIAEQLNVNDYITLQPPEKWQGIAALNQPEQRLAQLQAVYPDLDYASAKNITPFIRQIASLPQGFELIEFDYKRYLESVSASQNSIFIVDQSQIGNALKAYFRQQGFQITKDVNTAYWQIHVEPNNLQDYRIVVLHNDTQHAVFDAKQFPTPSFLNRESIDPSQRYAFQFGLMQLAEALNK